MCVCVFVLCVCWCLWWEICAITVCVFHVCGFMLGWICKIFLYACVCLAKQLNLADVQNFSHESLWPFRADVTDAPAQLGLKLLFFVSYGHNASVAFWGRQEGLKSINALGAVREERDGNIEEMHYWAPGKKKWGPKFDSQPLLRVWHLCLTPFASWDKL